MFAAFLQPFVLVLGILADHERVPARDDHAEPARDAGPRQARAGQARRLVLVGLALGLIDERARLPDRQGHRRRARPRHQRRRAARSSSARRSARASGARSASASARSCATRSARSSARSSTCSCSRTCSRSSRARRHHRQVRVRRAQQRPVRRRPGRRRATCSDQLPAGLLLAAYAAILVIAGIAGGAAAGRHRLMHLRAATPQDAQAATDLVIAGDIEEVGEVDYSLGDLQDEWRELDLAAGHADRRGRRGHDRRLRPLPRQRPARPGRPAPQGRGLRHRDPRMGRARARRSAARRMVRQGVGDRGAAEPRAARGPRLRARSAASGGWCATRVPGETADETGLRAVARRGRAHAARDHQPRVRRRRQLRAQERRRSGRAASSTATTSTTRSQPHRARARATRSCAAGSRTRSTSRCSPSTPTHQGQGLGARLLQRRLRRRATASTVTLNVASDNPNAVKLYERVGMRQAWRVDDYQKALPD